jgi:4-oxalocrotonate tautomerase
MDGPPQRGRKLPVSDLDGRPLNELNFKGAAKIPIITIGGPPIEELDVKRALVKAVTEAAAKAYGMPQTSIITVLEETTPDNVAVGGELVLDRKK